MNLQHRTALIAVGLAALALLAALSHRIYPLTLYAPHVVRHAVSSLPGGWAVRELFIDEGYTPQLVVRKFYSVIAFAIVGIFVALSKRQLPARDRIVAAAVWVGGLSLVIEILQRFGGSTESFGSNLFDIACGAIGGAVGALIVEAFSVLRFPHRHAEPARSHLEDRPVEVLGQFGGRRLQGAGASHDARDALEGRHR